MPTAFSLSVSIVLYRTPPGQLRTTLEALFQAVACARAAGVLDAVSIALIDNDADPTLPDDIARWQARTAEQPVKLQLCQGHGNVGYGRGHNRVLPELQSELHLVLNPDVTLAPDCLLAGLQFLRAQPTVVAASPRIDPGDGSATHGCKRYPALLDLLLRGFAPAFVRQWQHRRLAHYAMAELPADVPALEVPIISGCFMLFRTEVLQQLGGFDEAYFLYFEDFDLSLRAHAHGLLAYVPAMQIVHPGGHAARKGLRHIALFARSGLRFYRTHGWRLW
jgi:GT2 family glycosyltransferase